MWHLATPGGRRRFGAARQRESSLGAGRTGLKVGQMYVHSRYAGHWAPCRSAATWCWPLNMPATWHAPCLSSWSSAGGACRRPPSSSSSSNSRYTRYFDMRKHIGFSRSRSMVSAVGVHLASTQALSNNKKKKECGWHDGSTTPDAGRAPGPPQRQVRNQAAQRGWVPRTLVFLPAPGVPEG